MSVRKRSTSFESCTSPPPTPAFIRAVQWVLRRWNQESWLEQTQMGWAQDKGKRALKIEHIRSALAIVPGQSRGPEWYVNSQGQTMVVLAGPTDFLMGSPLTEANRVPSDQLQHRERIERSFAIAATPVTVEQFLRFRTGHPYAAQFSPRKNCPINNVSWYLAAQYCNWMSQMEGLPEEEWCYLPNKDGRYEQGMKLAPRWFERLGLPPAHGSGVGIRQSRGGSHQPVLWGIGGIAEALRLVLCQFCQSELAGGRSKIQRLGPL